MRSLHPDWGGGRRVAIATAMTGNACVHYQPV